MGAGKTDTPVARVTDGWDTLDRLHAGPALESHQNNKQQSEFPSRVFSLEVHVAEAC